MVVPSSVIPESPTAVPEVNLGIVLAVPDPEMPPIPEIAVQLQILLDEPQAKI